jgi:hypothetical protein
MAAQLLRGHDARFAVFVSSQEDCRLSQLDDSDLVTQYLLVRLADDESAALAAVLAKSADRTLGDYTVGTCSHSRLPVVLLRIRFHRRAPAQGIAGDGEEGTIDRSLTEPWLDIADQAVLPPPGSDRPAVPFTWFRGES